MVTVTEVKKLCHSKALLTKYLLVSLRRHLKEKKKKKNPHKKYEQMLMAQSVCQGSPGGILKHISFFKTKISKTSH